MTSHDPEAAAAVEAELLSAARHADPRLAVERRPVAPVVGSRHRATRPNGSSWPTSPPRPRSTGVGRPHRRIGTGRAGRAPASSPSRRPTACPSTRAIWQLTAAESLDEAEAALDAAFADARDAQLDHGLRPGLAVLLLRRAGPGRRRCSRGERPRRAGGRRAAAQPVDGAARRSWPPSSTSARTGRDRPRMGTCRTAPSAGALPDSTPYRLLLHFAGPASRRCRQHRRGGGRRRGAGPPPGCGQRVVRPPRPGRRVAALAHARRGDDDDRQGTRGGQPPARPALGQQPSGRPGAGGRGSVQPPDVAVDALDRAIERLAPVTGPARPGMGPVPPWPQPGPARSPRRREAGSPIRARHRRRLRGHRSRTGEQGDSGPPRLAPPPGCAHRGRRRSRPASDRSPTWPRRAAPTGTSRRRCS